VVNNFGRSEHEVSITINTPVVNIYVTIVEEVTDDVEPILATAIGNVVSASKDVKAASADTKSAVTAVDNKVPDSQFSS
jgi:hypothetical protein